MQDIMNYTSPFNNVVSDARASEIQKMPRSPYFVKTGLFLQKSCGSEVNIGKFFLNISECVVKSVLRIRGFLNISVSWNELYNKNFYTENQNIMDICQIMFSLLTALFQFLTCLID